MLYGVFCIESPNLTELIFVQEVTRTTHIVLLTVFYWHERKPYLVSAYSKNPDNKPFGEFFHFQCKKHK